MKFQVGETLYYVNPFVFTIEIVTISFLNDDFYCDAEHAVFEEKDLFRSLGEAKVAAYSLLEKFYHKKTLEIKNFNEGL